MGTSIVVDVDRGDSVCAVQAKLETMTEISGEKSQLLFQGRHIPASHVLLSDCGIGNEATLSLAVSGCGGMSVSDRPAAKRPCPSRRGSSLSVDAAFEHLGTLRRCTQRIHRFSPGEEGRELLADGDRCATLGHWSLITCGKAASSTLSPVSLHAASAAGRPDAVEALVSYDGLDVTARDAGGWTALHFAMVCGSEPLVRCLLALGEDDTATDDGVHASSLRPALWSRATGKHVAAVAESWAPPGNAQEAVDHLVQIVAEGNESTEVLCRRVCAAVETLGPAVLQEMDTEERQVGNLSMNWTVLAAAASNGQYSLCCACVELGAEFDHTVTGGLTPLHAACQNGNIHCVQLFLNRGADVNRAVNIGATPLFIACREGQVGCVRLLVDCGADVNKAKFDGATPLFIACDKGHVDCARMLLNGGAAVDKARMFGGTPVFIACKNGQVECVQELIDWGADVDRTTRDGDTPLFMASENGHADCVRLLVDRGANMHAVSGIGTAPLHVACEGNHRHVAAVLLELGVDPTMEGGGGNPAFCARQMGCPDHELADAMDVAMQDRKAAIERLRGMNVEGPRS